MPNSNITILVDDYYFNPAYYRFMPETVFTALEFAFINGEQEAIVPEDDFISMNNKILANHEYESN